MPRVPDNVMDRSRTALLELLGGNPGESIRAVLSPQTLAPESIRTTAERLSKTPSTAMEALTGTITNPFVLLGAALHLKFPVPTVDRLARFTEKAAGFAKSIPGLRWILDLENNFPDSRIPAILRRISNRVAEHTDNSLMPVAIAIDEYAKSTGTMLSDKSATRIAAAVDGIFDPDYDIFKRLGARFPNLASKLKVREPLTDTESLLVDRLRKIMYGNFQSALETAKGVPSKDVRSLLQRLGVANIDEIETLKNYWPRVARRDPESLAEIQKRVMLGEDVPETGAAFFGEDKRESLNRAAKTVGGLASPSARRRYGFGLPDPDALQKAGLIDEEVASALSKYRKEIGGHWYSLNLFKTIEKYTFGMARMKAWMTPDPQSNNMILGDVMRAEYNALKDVDPARARMLRKKWIPLATGQATENQEAWSNAFSDLKEHAAKVLEGIPGIPKDLRNRLMAPLREEGPGFGEVGSRVARYLYGSTLAFPNIRSAGINLFQNLNTMALIGTKNWVKGVGITRDKFKTWLDELDTLNRDFSTQTLRQNMDIASRRAFPEFYRQNLGVTSDISEQLEKIVATHIRKSGKPLEKLLDVLMVPFQGTELFNRMSAFYGARWQAFRDLAGKTVVHPVTQESVKLDYVPEKSLNPTVRDNPWDMMSQTPLGQFADDHAAYITRTAHYGSGALSTPYALLGTPAPFRQFLSFPLKSLGFMVGPATRYGAKGAGGRNYGTLGRMLMGGGTIYEIGQAAFGTDLSNYVLTGTMPQIRADGPFAPLPVPPLLQLAGGAAMDLASGSFENTRKNLPLLVPGGVGLSRIAPLVSRTAANVLGKPYADWEAREPDGRVPVRDARGNLIGRFTNTQIFAKAVGIGDLSTDQEREMAGYLLAQRERIAGLRRAYMEALSANNLREAQAISSEYERLYPGTGGIALKKSSISSFQMRRDLPRLQRILTQLPESTRQLFAGVVATSLGAQADQFLENRTVADGLRERGSSRYSAPYEALKRRAFRTTGLPGPQPSARNGEPSREALDAGRQRRDSVLLNMAMNPTRL